MNRIGPISILHVIAISLTMIGLKNHVSILPAMLSTGGRDGWMAVILSAILIFPWLFLLLYIHNQSKQQSMREWLLDTAGPRNGKVLLYIISFYLVFNAAISMREAIQWMEMTFLPLTPLLILLILFTILCILLASSNIQTIAILNVIVLLGVLILGFFIAFVNITVKDYSLLFPMLEDGMEPVWKATVFPASGYTELLFLLLIQQHFKDKMKWYHFGILLFLICGLTLGPLIGAIVEFGPDEAAKQQYPAYEEWGLATIGHYIEHVDFFSIYQWLTGAFIRVGVLLFIVVELLDLKQKNKKKKIWLVLAPVFFFLCIYFVWLNDQIFTKIRSHYFIIFSFVFTFILAFILAGIAYFSKKKRKNEDNKQDKLGRRRRAKSNRKEKETS